MRTALSQSYPTITFSSCSSEAAFFVDYSKSTNKARGAELHCALPTIEGLRLLNADPPVVITAAIFDDHCFKKADAPKDDDEHCEAVLFPEPFQNDSWQLFIELKYDKELAGKPQKAFNQLLNTIGRFRLEKIIGASKLVYALAYFPETARKPPYEANLYTFEDLRMLKKKERVMLVSSDQVTVMSDKYLKIG